MNTVLVIILTFACWVALAAGFLWLYDHILGWWNRDRRSPEQKAHDEAALYARLENPKWDEVERITGGRASVALIALYADLQLIHRKGFYIQPPLPGPDHFQEENIGTFEPADEVAWSNEWYQYLPRTAFPFATNLDGDFLFVELIPAGDDLPVKHLYHDGGDIETVAPSLAAFLSWKRSDKPMPE